MIFGKKDNLIGLDIGSSFIKVADIKVTGNGQHVLQKFGMSKIAPGTIAGGRIIDIDALANDIKTLLKSQKIRKKNVAISTGGHSIVIKTINIPNKPQKELYDIILSQAEQYIPYDIDDVNIDYQILGQSEFSPDQVNVLIVAVKKDIVAEYIDLIHMAGLNPGIIDVDMFAFRNTYEILSYKNKEKVTLLVDAGTSKTSLNILTSNTSLMMRNNVPGINQIIEEICNHYDITVDEAYQSMDGKNNTIDQDKIQAISLKIAQALCSEICEVINTFQSETIDRKVENIILSGGGVFIKGLKQSFLSELEADVSIINPFKALIVNKQRFPDSFIDRAGPLAPIAIGLALRRVDDK